MLPEVRRDLFSILVGIIVKDSSCSLAFSPPKIFISLYTHRNWNWFLFQNSCFSIIFCFPACTHFCSFWHIRKSKMELRISAPCDQRVTVRSSVFCTSQLFLISSHISPSPAQFVQRSFKIHQLPRLLAKDWCDWKNPSSFSRWDSYCCFLEEKRREKGWKFHYFIRDKRRLLLQLQLICKQFLWLPHFLSSHTFCLLKAAIKLNLYIVNQEVKKQL